MWVALQLPQTIEGNTLTLYSLVVNGAEEPHQFISGVNLDHSQWISHGHWIAAPVEGSELTLPSTNGNDKNGPTSDVAYTADDHSRIWLTKLVYDASIQREAKSNHDLMIELKITYPDSVFGEEQADQDNSYLFTIPVYSTSNAQSKLETDYYSTTPPKKYGD